VERRPRRYVTLDGYAVEGGIDGPYQPSTCFRPTIALGRQVGPGDAADLWHDYEQVLDLVPAMGFDGVRLTVEWARIEPHRGQVDESALTRYGAVADYANALSLGVTVVIVNRAWPAWLGLEAWLLPWVAPLVVEQARRVVSAIGAASGVVVFANSDRLVSGFLDSNSPPWRRGARVDAEFARQQIAAINQMVRDDPSVGSKIVASTNEVSCAADLPDIRAALESDCDEVYVRTLVQGHGFMKGEGILRKSADGWHMPTRSDLFEILR
jgi:hypothetical protein